MSIAPDYIGQQLLKHSFRDWFIYMFKVVENRKFIEENLHSKMFDWFEGIFNGKHLRSALNLPPRSGKTTLCEYFLVYALTVNPKAQIIYTSYSQALLNEIANKVASILEHPVYKAMYPNKNITIDEEEAGAVDEFWKEYLNKDNKRNNVYSNKLIRTYAGGVCLFSGCGKTITGFGAGERRNTKKFTGCLIMDDLNKPADISSQVMRNKVARYFDETLLSRLNNSNVPIINVQQRLHLEDITGYLQIHYDFETLKMPLLDDSGNCNLPSQYTPERIKELQVNNYMFQAQYQQEPIQRGGNLIKGEWFKYYDISVKYKYTKIVMALDSAISSKESADRSVFLVGGITDNNQLHILDMNASRSEYPQLKQICYEMYNKFQFDKRTTSMSAIYIENRASGQQLIQEINAKGLPIIAVEATKDKGTRISEILEYIQSGQVFLPSSEIYGFNPDFLGECMEFDLAMTHSHDDVCFSAGTKIATLLGYKNIEEITNDDLIITPYGLKKVIACGCTGESEVIEKLGLRCTPNHKIYANNRFDKIKNLAYDVQVDTLTLKGLLLWNIKILFGSMALNTDLWGRKGIILANQQQMKEEEKLKGYMSQFGNIIAGKQFRKVILFITKTVIALIMTILIWNVFQLANIIKGTQRKKAKEQKQKSNWDIWTKLENLQKNGTKAKQEKSGINNMLKTLWQKRGLLKKNENAHIVEKNILQKHLSPNIVAKLVKQERGEKLTKGKYTGKLTIKNAPFVEKSLQQIKNAKNTVQKNVINKVTKSEKVYNLTVESAGVYYANNILVSNCDSLAMLINNTIAHRKISLLDVL